MENKIEHHKEEDFILLVLRCCHECGGTATHEDVRDYIEHQLDLNDADVEALKSDGTPRWHRIIHNLKSHGKIQRYAEDVPGGFRLTDEGESHVRENFASLPQFSKPWKRIDKTVATRETVCDKWGNKILFALRDAGRWKKEEITRDVDSGKMNMTEFEEKYSPCEFATVSAAPPKKMHP